MLLILKPKLIRLLLISVLINTLLILSACEKEPILVDFKRQSSHFLQSLELAQQANQILQSNKTPFAKAFDHLDQAMSHAFELNQIFLNELEPRLYHHYSAYFMKGIELYRLGVEAVDAKQQKQGLVLLKNWWDYWQQNQKSILQKLKSSE